jgi:hypothetical protein
MPRVFDNSIFCLTLHPDAKPRATVDRVADRIAHLLATIHDEKDAVILPTPALSEFLVFAGEDAPEYLLKIRESCFLRIEPFDERAAIELADIEITTRKKGFKAWQCRSLRMAKSQIRPPDVAIAKVHGASVIYSDDPDIAAHGLDAGIEVLGLAALPLPPTQQLSLPGVLGEEKSTASTPASESETNTNEE